MIDPEPVYVPLQAWTCEKCHARGEAEMPADSDVFEWYTRLRAAHRMVSPECHRRFGAHFVRVKNIELPKGAKP